MILLFTKNAKGPDVGLDLAEGVDSSKFLVDSVIAPSPASVQELFLDNGYDLKSSQGLFAKTMTASAKDLDEIGRGIARIASFGLKDVVNKYNMSVRTFKASFLDRLEKCMKAGVPFLNSDNTFIKALDYETTLDEYIASNRTVVEPTPVEITPIEVQTPVVTQMEAVNEPVAVTEVVESAPMRGQEVEESIDEIVANMDEFDKQLYYSTIESLNYLVLANATNNTLASIISAIPKSLADAIVRQEHQYLGTRGMVSNIMEGLGVVPGCPEAEMILNAIPEMEISVGRGRAA